MWRKCREEMKEAERREKQWGGKGSSRKVQGAAKSKDEQCEGKRNSVEEKGAAAARKEEGDKPWRDVYVTQA